MYRIRPNRCGYGESATTRDPQSRADGYYCNGVSALKAVFTSDAVKDTELNRTSDLTSYINNYLNLPPAARGFVMSGVPIMPYNIATNMASKTTVPEISCPKIDLKNAWKYADTKITVIKGYAYSDSSSDSSSGSSASSISSSSSSSTTSEGPEDWADSRWKNTKDEPLNFTKDTSIFIPGLLEPMLDTDFEPVNVTGPAAVDMSLDGIAVAFSMLSRWRQSVVSSVKTTENTVNIDGNIALPNNNGCTSGCVLKKSGGGDLYGSGGDPKPKFKISCGSGALTVNGKSMSVSGDLEFNSGKAYLSIPFSATKDDCYCYCKMGKAKLTTSPSENAINIGLGGVTRMDKALANGKHVYSYHVEANPNCKVNIQFDKLCKCSGDDSDNGVLLVPTPSSYSNASSMCTRTLFKKKTE